MSMWSYPAGAVINGVKIESRTVRGPVPVMINDVQYPSAILSAWPKQELNDLGIMEFIEDTVPHNWIAGMPVDIENDGIIYRTYPNAHLDNTAVKREQELAIYAELAQLDGVLPRSVEDLCEANQELYNSLPQINKDRIERKKELRLQLEALKEEV